MGESANETTPDFGICACGKTDYRTKENARKAVRMFQAKSGGPSYRVYVCALGGTHFTSRKKGLKW